MRVKMKNDGCMVLYCEECGTPMKSSNMILPRYKICPNCKHKTYFNKPINISVRYLVEEENYTYKKKGE